MPRLVGNALAAGAKDGQQGERNNMVNRPGVKGKSQFSSKTKSCADISGGQPEGWGEEDHINSRKEKKWSALRNNA